MTRFFGKIRLWHKHPITVLDLGDYGTLLSVENRDARDFYEREAAECDWTKAQLERQIQSSYFQRIVANRGKDGLAASDRERLPGEPTPAEAILKTTYVLEFLGSTSNFESIWEALNSREKSRLIRLMGSRIEFNAKDTSISVTFYPDAIRSLKVKRKDDAA